METFSIDTKTNLNKPFLLFRMERQSSISFNGIDTETEPNERLCPKYTKSFAYYTVKDRLPVILTKITDHLVRSKEEIKNKYGEDAEEDIKTVAGQISRLKNEVQTNKPLEKLKSSAEDVALWNDYLDEVGAKGDTPSWFQSHWLYTENYLYRRISEIFENTLKLKTYDPFQHQKAEAFEVSKNELSAVAKEFVLTLNTINECKDQLPVVVKYLKMCLWGNRCDLSLTNGSQMSEDESILSNIVSLDPFLLADDSSRVYNLLDKSKQGVVDFVHDNAAYELFTDWCLCDILCSVGLVSKVRFHAKKYPWYVSDVTRSDVKYLLTRLSEDEHTSKLAQRWTGYFKTEKWILYDENFWTTPFDNDSMKKRDPKLYHIISESDLVIFKGDLNYRKLLGDINWPHSEKFEIALRSFKPTNVLALRTVKADLICGVEQAKSDSITEKNPMWMRTGEYGLIQLYEKV